MRKVVVAIAHKSGNVGVTSGQGKGFPSGYMEISGNFVQG